MLNKETSNDILKSLEHVRNELFIIESRIRQELEMQYDVQQFNSIFKGKTAIIGNYDYASSEETKNILQLFGMDVEIVRTGIEILDKIKENQNYDVIFTNHIYQTGFNGEELLKQLRDIDGFNTPVIIHTIDKNMKYYYVDRLGFDEYIEKPIRFSDNDKILEFKEKLEKFFN